MSSALQTYEQIQWNIIKSLISMNDTSILSKSVSIEADDFLNDKYKELFIVISRAKSEYEGDLRTSVLFELIEDNKLPLTNDEIVDIFNNPVIESYSYLARKLKTYSLNYKMKTSLSTKLKKLDEDISVESIANISNVLKNEVEEIQKKIPSKTNDKNSLVETLESFQQRLQEKNFEEDPGIKIPYNGLQSYIQGWKKEKMITVGAGTGQGKSVFACNCAYEACKNGKSVLFFSLEMTREEIVERIISNDSKVSLYKFKKSEPDPVDVQKINKSLDKMKSFKLDIDDTPGITIDMIQTKALQKQKSEEGLDMIIIDYLQLIKTTTSFRSRQEEVADISRSIKLLAKSLKVPVMVLVQLNTRNKDSQESKIPTKDDIRESAAIAQDSDIVILIHREFKEDDVDPKATFFLDKHRGGPAGKYMQVRAAFHISAFIDPNPEENTENDIQLEEDTITDANFDIVEDNQSEPEEYIDMMSEDEEWEF